MGYSQENGYTPLSISTLMDNVRTNINAQFGTSYTAQSFVGTNFYKYFYALIQLLQENEVKTSEIFLKLQDYFEVTNERIQRPVVTNNGLIENLAASGYVASVKAPVEADRGKIYVCVDVDDDDPDYATIKADVNEIIKDSTVAGCVTMGTETSSIVLSNGQSFDFKFNLPVKTEVDLRLTITLSENNQVLVGSVDDVKDKLLENIAAKYALGKNFEPQRYFSVLDAPWASQVLLEYSTDNGSNWETQVYDADYDELFVCLLENITVVEN